MLVSISEEQGRAGGIMKKQDPYKALTKLLHSFPEYQLPVVLSVMEALRNSLEEQETKRKETEFCAYLDSLPEEDKELSDECHKHIAESRKAIAEGRVSSFEEVAEELGL